MYWLPGTPACQYPLPSNVTFSRSTGSDTDIIAWADLCRNGLIADDADPFETYERRILQKCRNEDVLFLDVDGLHAGTITAIFHPEEQIGEFHMVSIGTQFRGRGLSRYMNARALEILVPRAPRYIFLTTDEWRVPAIRGYLRAGFIPVDYDINMQQRWGRVLSQLGINEIEMTTEEADSIRKIRAIP